MAIAASGAVAMSDLRTEYNDTGSIALSDLYLGAASNLVRASANNNSSTNLSAGVPDSGVIKITDFYSKARGFRKTYSSGAENQDLSTVFGTDWGVDYPKDVVINAGVTLGATSTGNEALEVSSGGVGTITITNNGTIIGAGGAASGGAGGDAFEASVACTLINNGTISAGGGGGGQGGTGGNGSSTSTTRSPSSGEIYHQYFTYWMSGSETIMHLYYYVTSSGGYYTTNGYNYTGSTFVYNGWTHHKGSVKWSSNEWNIQKYAYYRTQTVTTTASGTAGGAGGQGAGYNQSLAAGSNASTASSPAGSGGQGGTGGGLGSSGSQGATGANGTTTNGAVGAVGGAAGVYIRGVSNVTLTQNGTVHGSTA